MKSWLPAMAMLDRIWSSRARPSRCGAEFCRSWIRARTPRRRGFAVDFAVGCGGRAADEFAAVQIGGPEDLAGFGFAGSNGLVAAFAVHHEEFAFIIKRRGYVAGQDVFVIADLTFALPNEVGALVRLKAYTGCFLGRTRARRRRQPRVKARAATIVRDGQVPVPDASFPCRYQDCVR